MENPPGFSAPHRWGVVLGPGASPRGTQQQSGCARTGPMACSINTHAPGLHLQTWLLGWTEKAWRCCIQASGENRTKLRNSYPGMTKDQGEKGGHQNTWIIMIKPELELSSPQNELPTLLLGEESKETSTAAHHGQQRPFPPKRTSLNPFPL